MNGLVELSLSASNRFAWATAGADHGPHPVFDRSIATTANFVVVPSMGSLVPGWLLVVPRRPAINLRVLSVPERAELAALRAQLSGALSECFQEAIYEFEHGAASLGSLTGCGVDQAHLHMLPLPFDLVEAARDLEPLTAFGDRQDPWRRIKDTEYVLLRAAAEDESFGFYPKEPSSQRMRRLIARRLGLGDAWNYREHAFEINAQATLEHLRP